MLQREGGMGDLWCPSSEPLIPCSPCTHSYPHYWTIGRVKFGVPLEQVCKNDIPGPLLVLILKLNKEGPTKKDVFRAPGHQGSMKKLIHFLQNGRLVNIDNFSVYTIASVLKKFLRKLPEGIFGRDGEQQLFSIIQYQDTELQRDHIHRLITSLPSVTQHLLVLLFGTFRVIAMNASRAQTGMTSEALGVSVAPSFFQSCVADGKTARMEDVIRFKVATQIMQFLIDNFGVSNLFGRANYEYYARITGRILKVEEDWIFAFRYPPESLVARQHSLEAEKTWLQYESERWGLKFNLEAMAGQEESQSTPALIHIPESTSSLTYVAGGVSSEAGAVGGVVTGVPENTLQESCTRLSTSLEENGLYKGNGQDSSSGSSHSALRMTLDELRQVNRYAESTKSLSYLPQVHERQTERMRTRSEWFLSHSPHASPLPPVDVECQPHAVYILRSGSINRPPSGGASSENVGSLLRRSSSKDKERKLVRRSSSKKDKENGQKGSRGRSSSADVKTPASGDYMSSPRRRAPAPVPDSPPALTDHDCTETDVQRVHVSLTYKPRI
ncbi:unconventional myosin-IXAb-like isoform X1 [Eriocheir sinensis]|uniref:unconventional myosin-IXAb-like isoform X1 n=2 Tax=Eriocheir sinensis TaxID=95602 RepID=UPI0021C5CFFE|nr:unconventional myosin-IXAb-like isoform X1 [Eriocheir sinensis]